MSPGGGDGEGENGVVLLHPADRHNDERCGGSRSSGHLQCAEGLVLEVVLPHSAVRVCSIHIPRTGVGGEAVDPHPLPAGHHIPIQALEGG